MSLLLSSLSLITQLFIDGFLSLSRFYDRLGHTVTTVVAVFLLFLRLLFLLVVVSYLIMLNTQDELSEP